MKEERGRERREGFFPATSLCALFIISVKKNGKWSRKRSTLALINPRPVSSLDAMLEIRTGLQRLTTSLAPIQEPCSTSFFSSHREDEVGNASRPFSQLRPAANRRYECGLLAVLESFFVFLFIFCRSGAAEIRSKAADIFWYSGNLLWHSSPKCPF